MLAARIAATAVRSSAARSATASTRFFTASATARADQVTDLYVKYLRSYKPVKDASAAAANLPKSFAQPSPPPKPEFEDLEASAATGTPAEAEAAAEVEAQWPPLYDPIDDPKNYPDAWNYDADNDDGCLLPQRTRPYDYHHGHGH